MTASFWVPTPIDVRIVANLSSPDWWNIGFTAGAVILGAIIGAIISWFVAKQAAQENRQTIKAAQKNAEEEATLRALTKLMELANAAAGYHFQVEREISEAKQRSDRIIETWQAMRPRVSAPPEIYITADDLVAFTRSRNFGYVTDLLHLVASYNSLVDGFKGYSKLRAELDAILIPETMEGSLGSASLTQEEYMRLAPRLHGVRTLADQIRQDAKDVYEGVAALIERFGPIVRAYFNDPHFPIPAIIKD